MRACAFSPDGKEVLAAPSDKTLHLHDRATGRLVRVFSGCEESATSCAFSPDGTEVLCGSFDHSLRLWDRATGALRLSFEAHPHIVTACAFSPDGKELLSTGADGTVRLWDRASGKPVRAFERLRGWVTACAFSPDGREVLAASPEEGGIRRWERSSGRVIGTLHGFTGPIAFAPGGEEMLLGDGHSHAALYDGATDAVIRTFDGGPSALSPDGREVLTTTDRAVHLWDTASGRRLHSFEGHVRRVTALTFAPDGGELLSASDDMTLRLWRLPRREPIALGADPVGAVELALARIQAHGRPAPVELSELPPLAPP